MGSAIGVISAIAATVAVLKLLTSKRGYLVLPGIKFSWGR